MGLAHGPSPGPASRHTDARPRAGGGGAYPEQGLALLVGYDKAVLRAVLIGAHDALGVGHVLLVEIFLEHCLVRAWRVRAWA